MNIMITLNKERVSLDDIEFEIVATSSKFDKIDVAFQYKESEYDNWFDDAIITESQSDYVNGNILIGVAANANGASTTFKWEYTKNFIQYGHDLQIRLKVLPKTINYSTSGALNIVSESYAVNKADIENSSLLNRAYNKNNSGQFICFTDTAIRIFDSLSDVVPVYEYSGLSYPKYALQKADGKYIIADYGYNRIVQLDATLTVVEKLYSISCPVFVNFLEADETLLACSENNNVIELDWNATIITILWQSNSTIIDPCCATYGLKNSRNIIICDNSKNEVFIYNKDSSVYTGISQYKLTSNSASEKISFLYQPFRAYELMDGLIWICEKEGRDIDFELLDSSSSSLSESSESSSSSFGPYKFFQGTGGFTLVGNEFIIDSGELAYDISNNAVYIRDPLIVNTISYGSSVEDGELDLTDMTNLTSVNANSSGITSIIASGLTSLVTLISRDGSLSSINITGSNNNLLYVDVNDNALSDSDYIFNALDPIWLHNGYCNTEGNAGVTGASADYRSALNANGWDLHFN